MKNAKMSLDAFKAKAENENLDVALDSIQGGGLFNCHGKSGQVGKAIGDVIDDIKIGYGSDGFYFEYNP
jgi:hypothetical protein